jgi:D-beta-D-heptose 7-phosphate kinase/D-beta-D-heptose 1-phosphate adenosyltransferase
MSDIVKNGDRDGLTRLRNHMILDYDKLRILADGLRVTGLRLGATIGSFDMLHCGHSRYLMAAKSQCDILFVAADSDAALQIYKKDPNRPVVPEDERLEMLLHTGYVDYATLISDVDAEGKWQYGFLDAVRPDVFVTSIGSYTDEQLTDIRSRCSDVVELPRQAETSTSEKVRQLMMIQSRGIAAQLRAIADTYENGEHGG